MRRKTYRFRSRGKASRQATAQESKLRGKHSDFVVEGPNEGAQVSLLREDADDSDHKAKYLIEEVTLYELDSRQEKRLSALFTASRAGSDLCGALASHDIDTLRSNSSLDFRRRAWDPISRRTLDRMPLNEIEDATPKVQSTVFNGFAHRGHGHSRITSVDLHAARSPGRTARR